MSHNHDDMADPSDDGCSMKMIVSIQFNRAVNNMIDNFIIFVLNSFMEGLVNIFYSKVG